MIAARVDICPGNKKAAMVAAIHAKQILTKGSCDQKFTMFSPLT
jgi:hypothetical protein